MTRGLVATSELHAGRAAAAALRAGGNAVDAALTAAACLTVTEPTSNGLGGDLFALVWEPAAGEGEGAVHALAAAGAAPERLTQDAVRAAGHTAMPSTGWLSVTVPGQVSGWRALAERFARRPLPELLAPAIALARDGFAVGPITAAAWARAAPRLQGFGEWRRVFLPHGRAPAAGERFRNPDLGASLERLARAGARDLYGGELARRIASAAWEAGAPLSASDLAAQEAVWTRPLEVAYGPWRVVGMTAPTQGVVALEALGVLAGLDVEREARDHAGVEAIKLAFADAYACVGDPAAMPLAPDALLRPEHLGRRRARLDAGRAGPSPAAPDLGGGTVLVCTGDAEGRLVSLIQSNFHGFGSGVVVPGTGLALQNRGSGFRLDPAHPNALAPGKRPFHTILPGLLRDAATGRGVGAYGCMGGQMQPQGHVQLLGALAAGATPQEALDRPRWRWLDEGPVALERGFEPARAHALAARGHQLREDAEPAAFGGGQIVLAGTEDLVGGSDPRKDGGVVNA